MKSDSMKAASDVADERLFDNWFDPVEKVLRTKVRGFIETMIEEELEMALSRPRYGRRISRVRKIMQTKPIVGHPDAIADRHIRSDPDRRPPRQDPQRERRQDGGMEEQAISAAPASRTF